MDIFLAHSLGLLWLSVGTARRLVRHPVDRLLAAALLVWGNLTATQLLLGLAHRLDEPGWILGTSLVLAALLWSPRSGLVPTSAPADATAVGPGTGLWLAAGLVVIPLDSPASALPSFAGTIAGLVFVRPWRQGHLLRHALLGALAAALVAGGLSGHLRPDLRWSASPPSIIAATPPAPDERRPFVQNLVLSPATGPAVTEGLRPAEGPLPRHDLPRFRSVRQPGIRLLVPDQAGLARLSVRFSLGLLQRDKTEIAVLINGRTVRQCRFIRQDGWADETLELDAHPGGNVLEFADVPHQQELDWRGYLERYPDVMRHLVTNHIPLEEGARSTTKSTATPRGGPCGSSPSRSRRRTDTISCIATSA